MFEYAEDAHKLKLRLGQYVSHNVALKKPFTPTTIRTIDELNILDRVQLAQTFLNSKEKYYFFRDLGPVFDMDQLIDDTARYIDSRIPKAFIKWRDHPNESANWTVEGTGLIYHYPENYQHGKGTSNFKSTLSASKDQKNYLKSLLADAGYILKVDWDDLNMQQAGDILNYLIDDIELPPGDFEKLLEYDV